MRSYLDKLFGNESTRIRLGEACLSGTVSHAFLIEGDIGSGKHTLARELAMALNCEKIGDASFPLPCHNCSNCRRISSGSFTDVKYLRKQKNKATIGVEDVKLFKEDMYLSATESEYKIYIIENAECMTPQAQNALLITLEEPPENVVIMLLSEQSDKLLSTIKSRVQHIAMSRFTLEELSGYVTRLSSDASRMNSTNEKKFKSLLISADGSIGKALSMIDPERAKENEKKRELTEKIIRKMTVKSSYAELYLAMKELSSKRNELSGELESIILALRDIISKKIHAKTVPYFFTSDEELCSIASEFDIKRLFYLFDTVSSAYADNAKNANITTLITNMTAKIKEGR